MPTLLDLEPQVLALSESERIQLISSLLVSLPSEEVEEEDDISIALRREMEAEADPSLILSEEEFWQGIRSETP